MVSVIGSDSINRCESLTCVNRLKLVKLLLGKDILDSPDTGCAEHSDKTCRGENKISSDHEIPPIQFSFMHSDIFLSPSGWSTYYSDHVGYIDSYSAQMMIFNHFPKQLLMLSFRLEALKLYLEDSGCLSGEHRTTIEQPNLQRLCPKKWAGIRDISPGH